MSLHEVIDSLDEAAEDSLGTLKFAASLALPHLLCVDVSRIPEPERAAFAQAISLVKAISSSFLTIDNDDMWAAARRPIVRVEKLLSGDARDPGTQALQAPKEPPPIASNRVLVVHGRNDMARDAVFSFLRAIGLQPMEWSQALALTGKPTPFVGEVLEAAFSRASAVLVVLTPDDLAHLAPHFVRPDDPAYERDPTPQARPNVLFEAGMAMGRCPERTVLVQLGQLRPFSDLGGRHVVRLDDSTKRRQDVAERLGACGCRVDLTGRDWHTTGNFAASLESSASVATSGPEPGKALPPLPGTDSGKSDISAAAQRTSDLVSAIGRGLEEDGSGLIREFVLLPNKNVRYQGSKPRFAYYADEIPDLQLKADMLERAGLLRRISGSAHSPVYEIAEAFVGFLEAKAKRKDAPAGTGI